MERLCRANATWRREAEGCRAEVGALRAAKRHAKRRVEEGGEEGREWSGRLRAQLTAVVEGAGGDVPWEDGVITI